MPSRRSLKKQEQRWNSNKATLFLNHKAATEIALGGFVRYDVPMEILSELFGGAARVKLMRLFLFHPHIVFDEEALEARSKVSRKELKRQLRELHAASLVSSRTVPKGKKRKVQMWSLNEEFTYLPELKQLLINTALVRHGDVAKRFQKVGKIKLLVLTGVFIQQENDSRVDLLVVGDGIRKNALENAMKILESEVGKEISYAAFETADFKYRLSMYDKLIRDILDFPHEKLINKINV